jgi:PEP-CTERM motif
MNPNSTRRLLVKNSDRKVWNATRRFAAILFIFTLVIPAHAGPILINQVAQTISPSQGSVDLRIKNISQSPRIGSSQDPKAPPAKTNQDGTEKNESLLSGVTISTDAPTIGVEVLEEAVVEGSVCDCGEIIIPGGAFPKWPFLFLAALPLAFIDTDSNENATPTLTPTATPTPLPPGPTPTPRDVSQVPEPTSLLLFGTGLLAFGTGLRRRYLTSKHKAEEQAKGDE